MSDPDQNDPVPIEVDEHAARQGMSEMASGSWLIAPVSSGMQLADGRFPASSREQVAHDGAR